MELVSEAVIERVVAGLEDADYERLISNLQDQQEEVLAWIFSDEFEAFTRREREFLLYLLLVIARAVQEVRKGPLPDVDPEQISEREEANWSVLGQSRSRVFHERLDPFFEQTDQEDLLAFAEDSLSDYEDGLVTPEGREALFVVLKTIIDCWTQD